MIIDLSQTIENGMTFFPGDPEPHLVPASCEAPWRVTHLHLGSHTGTHLDAPAHIRPDGMTVTDLPLKRLIVSGVVAHLPDLQPRTPISAQMITATVATLPRGDALLLRTGWDRFWRQPAYLEHPYLTPQAAQLVVDAGASLVGIDALNVDDTPSGASAVHEVLLGASVLIVENLCHLDQLAAGRAYRFSFLPLPLANSDGSPVRAVAWPANERADQFGDQPLSSKP